MQQIALVIHVILAIGVIGLVLMQHGKGADAGAAFGSGASGTVFGARGSASFLTRTTTILAGLFFLTSVVLFYLAAHRDATVRSVTDVPGLVDEAAPAADLPSDLPGDLPGAVADPVDGEGVTGDAAGATGDASEGVTGEATAGDAVEGTVNDAVEGAVEGASSVAPAAQDLPAPAQ